MSNISLKKNPYAHLRKRDEIVFMSVPSYVARSLASNDVNALPAAFRALHNV